MSNIIKASITIRGTRAFLWNAFTPEAIPLAKQEKSGVAGNDPDEWRKSVLMTQERQLYIEPTYIFGCLRDGAKYTKKGRGSLQPKLVATLQVLDERSLMDRFLPPDDQLSSDPAQPVYLDIRSVKNPATRARNVRYRIAASPGWRLSFNIEWDKTLISRPEMQAIANDAGQFCGLGDGRTVGFGRFAVEAFTLSGES
ncbi:MAG: hypothetical protein KJ077_27280 [Anaerolineae bacterium]|nr:hypothetical protein [Anaerolineae bacterium]